MTTEPDIEDIIRWWEQEIDAVIRDKLMGNYSWHGSAEERHEKLREMYQKYKEATQP